MTLDAPQVIAYASTRRARDRGYDRRKVCVPESIHETIQAVLVPKQDGGWDVSFSFRMYGMYFCRISNINGYIIL